MNFNLIKFILLTVVLLLQVVPFFGNEAIHFKNENNSQNISGEVQVYEDKTGTLSIDSIHFVDFENLNHKIANFGVSPSIIWVKIPITNQTDNPKLLIEVSLPILDYIGFYTLENGSYNLIEIGEDFVFSKRKYKEANYLFDAYIVKGETKVYYLKVASNEAIQLPLKIGTKDQVLLEIKYKDLLSGIYVGIMLVMIFYNLFIYFSVRDISYIYYVIYITSILLTQTSVQGYTFQFLWPNYPVVTKMSLVVLSSLSGVTGILFMNVFLRVKEHCFKFYVLSFLFFVPYGVSITLAFLGFHKISYVLMEINAGVVSVFMLTIAILVYLKGYQPAKYFLVAWIVFLIGVVVFILKDLEVLPFNNYTRYMMQIGSAIETVLLSFALASRINIYKKERFEALKINELIIRDQNATLELKVVERTSELENTLAFLKNTQSKLVEAEKMSSLGLLTAGIAHEINNPINFVSSNIFPLRQDIADIKKVISLYEAIKESDNIQEKLAEIEALKKTLDFDYLKEELDIIINGIEEGAERTAAIVKGLRTFSRLDEGPLKNVDINEGIEATVLLMNSKLDGIALKLELGKIPTIECNPGKLNQVFMNLIDNAIFAVKKKNIPTGYIRIKTIELPSGNIQVTIQDTGNGIPSATLEKLFEPFFTTKKIGEGTGLGLSIVKNIIDDHNGTISIDSTVNKGTKIEIELPQKKKKNE